MTDTRLHRRTLDAARELYEFHGDYDPSVVGCRAAVGSVFHGFDGAQWRKTGEADTAWTDPRVVADAPASVPVDVSTQLSDLERRLAMIEAQIGIGKVDP